MQTSQGYKAVNLDNMIWPGWGRWVVGHWRDGPGGVSEEIPLDQSSE